MMREKVGVILATATILSGCDTALGAPIEQRTPTIQLDQLPDVLPPEVTKQIPNVAAITGEVKSFDPSYQTIISTTLCSGVRIDEYDYLSAGHCVNLNSLPQDLTPYCKDIRVDMPIDQQEGITLNGTHEAGYAPGSMTASTLDFFKQGDVLLVEVKPNSQPSYDNPTHFSETSDIEQGTPLYFVNYQPTEDRLYRNPNKDAQVPPEHLPGPHTPAILGGIAIRNVNSDTIEVISAGKSYGDPVDTDIRFGASGGPVYDQNGNLVARIVAVANEKISVETYENNHHIDITDMPDETMLRTIYIKESTPNQIDELQQIKQSLPRC